MTIKKFRQSLLTFALVIFLVVIISPLTFSQEKTTWKRNIEATPEIFTAQASSESNGESAPEVQEKQEATPESSEDASSIEDAPVVLDGETLFTYSSKVQGMPAQDRAQRVTREIEEFAKDFSDPIDSLKITVLEGLRIISSEEEILFALVEADAQAANRSLDELANEYLQKVKGAISQYREKRSFKNLLFSILFASIETIIFIFLLIVINKIFAKIHHQIDTWRTRLFRSIRIQNLQILSTQQQANLFLRLVKLIHWVIVASLILLYFSLLTRHFPQTKPLAKAIFSSLYNVLVTVGNAIINYLPNLFTIFLTIFITYYIIRFCQLFFNALDRGTLSFRGFDQDWARPTYKITILLILAVALAVIFPYLPGSEAPAFRGVSILIGALITLGGASAVSNLIGGIIIIYTRAFRIGDLIEIGSFKGKVYQKTILSTRILTINNELVTIPNATLIASSIVNYNAILRELNEPMVVHTSITLGYDLPWRKVEHVLCEAARTTSGILEEPSPFVRATSLDDFYVSYELRAYANDLSKLKDIYIQLDCCDLPYPFPYLTSSMVK